MAVMKGVLCKSNIHFGYIQVILQPEPRNLLNAEDQASVSLLNVKRFALSSYIFKVKLKIGHF